MDQIVLFKDYYYYLKYLKPYKFVRIICALLEYSVSLERQNFLFILFNLFIIDYH